MALSTSTINFDAKFRYDLATKQIVVTDTTDYTTAGVSTSNVTVIIKAETVGGGTFYNNVNHSVPDIDPNTSLDSTIVIPLPLDGSSLPVHDTYIITLEWQDTTGVAYEVTLAKNFTLDYVSPIVDIDMEVDCLSPLLSAIDNTNYTIDGIDPTIVRAFAIHYPPSTPTADVTGTGATLTTNVFYTVSDSTIEHSSSLTSDLEYDFGGGFIVIDEVIGSDVVQVSCDGDVCTIYCCMKTVLDKYNAVKGKNGALETIEYKKLVVVSVLSQFAFMAMRCNRNKDVSAFISSLLEIAECNVGCGCTDGEPQLVTGLGISGTSISVVAGSGISVSVAGSVYTVSLSSANLAKLSAMYNSVVTAGTNITVTPTTVVASGVTTTTYNVAATDTIPDILLVEFTIDFTSGVVPVITTVSEKLYNTVLKLSNTIVNDNNGSALDWQNKMNSFTFSDFFASASASYYSEIVSVEEAVYLRFSGDYPPKQTHVDIYDKNTTDFKFRLINASNGSNMLGKEIDSVLTQIKLVVKINA